MKSRYQEIWLKMTQDDNTTENAASVAGNEQGQDDAAGSVLLTYNSEEILKECAALIVTPPRNLIHLLYSLIIEHDIPTTGPVDGGRSLNPSPARTW